MKWLIGYATTLGAGMLGGVVLGLALSDPLTVASAGDPTAPADPAPAAPVPAPGEGPVKSLEPATRPSDDDCQAALAEARQALALMETSMRKPVASWPASLPESFQPHAAKASFAAFVAECDACSGARIDCSEPPCMAILHVGGSPVEFASTNMALTKWPDFENITVSSAVVETEEGFYLIKPIIPINQTKHFVGRTQERIDTLKAATHEGWLHDASEPVGD